MRVIISVFRQPSASGFDSAIKLPGRARFVRGGHGIGSGLSSLSGGDDAGTVERTRDYVHGEDEIAFRRGRSIYLAAHSHEVNKPTRAK